MIAALDGVDLIVFTGGIGENDPEARAVICRGLSWIGVSLDEARNRSANNPKNDAESRCQVLVLTSQEDEQIASHTWSLFPRRAQRIGVSESDSLGMSLARKAASAPAVAATMA